jgi:hypothetical protein
MKGAHNGSPYGIKQVLKDASMNLAHHALRFAHLAFRRQNQASIVGFDPWWGLCAICGGSVVSGNFRPLHLI